MSGDFDGQDKREIFQRMREVENDVTHLKSYERRIEELEDSTKHNNADVRDLKISDSNQTLVAKAVTWVSGTVVATALAVLVSLFKE